MSVNRHVLTICNHIENIDKEKLLEYALNYDISYEVGKRYAYNNVEPFILSVFLKEKLNSEKYCRKSIFDE